MILQILGVIFIIIIIILVVAYYIWKIKRYIKSSAFSDFSKALATLPQLDMELEPSNRGEWKEKEQLDFSEKQLKSVGANHVGYYTVDTGYATMHLSMWSYQHLAVVVVYEGFAYDDEGNVVFVIDACCKLDDGSICVTSNTMAVNGARPDKHQIYLSESASVPDILRLLKLKISSGIKVQKITDAKDFFIECYEDITEWAWKKEQLLSDRTHQVLLSVGVDVTDELLNTLVEMGANYSIEVNQNRVRRLIARHANVNAETWEKIRDRLIIINDLMQVNDVLDAIYDLAGELSEKDELAIEGFENNTGELVDPIAAFQMLSQVLNLKIKRVASFDSPVKTEVYLPLN